MFKVAYKKTLQRKSVYTGRLAIAQALAHGPEFIWEPRGEKYDTRVEAMRSFFGSESKDWSDDMVKRQFKPYQYNWKHVKIVRV